jgi:hypothetical protein
MTAYYSIAEPTRADFSAIYERGVWFLAGAVTISTLGIPLTRYSSRRYGFTSWDELALFDEPYGPTLKEILARDSRDDNWCG